MSATTATGFSLPSSRAKSFGSCLGNNRDKALSEASDETLLGFIQSHDQEALAHLFRRYAKVVHSIGRRILGDEAEAEDLVQDVFLYIHRKCGVYNSAKGKASSWIVQTSYYQALQRRMRLTARHYYSSIKIEESTASTQASPVVADYDHSAEGIFGRSGWRKVLETLTEDQWETLRMHFFEGYTLPEIAEKRGQTLGNIRHHFYRGLEALRKHVFSCVLDGLKRHDRK